MTIQRVVLAVLIFLLASNPDLGNAAQWYVDASVPESGDGTTWETAFKPIQRGLNAASDGDTVIVARGTYIENIHFRGKNVVLRSIDPLDPDTVANTVIDGNGVASVVSFTGTEDETCILSGFTIRNGRADLGGGILGREGSNHTHATIENNVITGNSAGKGGGLFDCDGRIRNNLIAENIAEGAFLYGVVYGLGAGLAYCDGTIEDNIITGNATKGGGCPTLPCVYSDGGGLAYSHGTIRNNTITQNQADRGGGLYYCNGTIQDNTVTDNHVQREGGGLAYCDGMIDSNTITGNSAYDEGGGLAYCDATIRNNTITGNVVHGGAGYGGHGSGLSDCDGAVENNIISGNSSSRGGGLTFCDGRIENNTITENYAKLEGGALYFCHGAIQNNTISQNSVGVDGGGAAQLLGHDPEQSHRGKLGRTPRRGARGVPRSAPEQYRCWELGD